MKQSIIIDTDVASALIRRRPLPAVLADLLRGAETAVTFVTIGELHKWAGAKRWGSAARADLSSWLSRQKRLGYDDAVAEAWGNLAAAAELRGRTAPQNDMWIAACCLIERQPLATLNKRDFVDFVSHHGLELVEEVAGQGV